MASPSTDSPQSENMAPGSGRIVARAHGSKVIFSELSSTYPLKLLSPRVAQEGVAIVYVLSYGGGLVGGDRVKLSVDIGPNVRLVMLSQGSTKVFKTRQEIQRGISTSRAHSDTTRQHLEVVLSGKSALFLLPEPVTCFRSASYNQTQSFHLARNSSAVVLDWVTSGRKSLGEEWVFSRYYSANEIWLEGKRVARDATLLETQEGDMDAVHNRSLKDRLFPYSCFATLLLYGPLMQETICDLVMKYSAISVFKTSSPADLIWSLSPLDTEAGCVVRVAGKESESVKIWLGDMMRKLEHVVGVDVYRKTFS